MSKRLDHLRSYLLEVTRDLISRGMIRHRRGESLDQILRTEWQTVLHSTADDLKTMGLEAIGGLAGSFLQKVFGA
jgi:hypothetical protein